MHLMTTYGYGIKQSVNLHLDQSKLDIENKTFTYPFNRKEKIKFIGQMNYL